MRLMRSDRSNIRLLMFLGHQEQFVDCRGNDGDSLNINYYNNGPPHTSNRIEHVYISTLLHAMLHRFLFEYACACPTCVPNLDRNKGVLRRASHGPNWANAMVAIGQAMQDLVNWELDVGIEVSVGNDIGENWWLASPDQRRRWAVDEGTALVRGRHNPAFLDNAQAEIEERDRREELAMLEEQRREEEEKRARQEWRRAGQREIEGEAVAREGRRAANDELQRIRRAQMEQTARLEREREEGVQANQERAARLQLREEEARRLREEEARLREEESRRLQEEEARNREEESHRLQEEEARNRLKDSRERRRGSRDGQAHQGRANTQQGGGPSGPRQPRAPQPRKETPAEREARKRREADHEQAQLRRLQ